MRKFLNTLQILICWLNRASFVRDGKREAVKHSGEPRGSEGEKRRNTFKPTALAVKIRGNPHFIGGVSDGDRLQHHRTRPLFGENGIAWYGRCTVANTLRLFPKPLYDIWIQPRPRVLYTTTRRTSVSARVSNKLAENPYSPISTLRRNRPPVFPETEIVDSLVPIYCEHFTRNGLRAVQSITGYTDVAFRFPVSPYFQGFQRCLPT